MLCTRLVLIEFGDLIRSGTIDKEHSIPHIATRFVQIVRYQDDERRASAVGRDMRAAIID